MARYLSDLFAIYIAKDISRFKGLGYAFVSPERSKSAGCGVAHHCVELINEVVFFIANGSIVFILKLAPPGNTAEPPPPRRQ